MFFSNMMAAVRYVLMFLMLSCVEHQNPSKPDNIPRLVFVVEANTVEPKPLVGKTSGFKSYSWDNESSPSADKQGQRPPTSDMFSSAHFPSGDPTTLAVDTRSELNTTFQTTLTSLTGRVDWVGSGHASTRTWLICLNSWRELGLVLRFHDVQLVQGDRVEVHGGPQAVLGSQVALIAGSLPVAPLLIPEGQATVRLEAFTPPRQTPEGTVAGRRSRFSFSYEAHPALSLPPPVIKWGIRRYNCSPPYQVPEALRCDMVPQCVLGQDEALGECDYHRAGCPYGFVPFRALCLHFSRPMLMNVPEAVAHCSRIGASLLGLEDPMVKRFVINVTNISGYRRTFVNLKNGMALNPLYRFLWLWKSMRLELQAPFLNVNKPKRSCAVLNVQPSVSLELLNCAKQIRSPLVCVGWDHIGKYSHSDDGISPKAEKQLVCHEPNSSSVQSLHLQTCSDGSLVHPFHACPNGPSGSSLQSAVYSRFRRFQCSEKSIDFTRFCDGHQDCDVDEVCKVDSSFIDASFFMCLTENIIHIKFQCNGLPECKDANDEVGCRLCSKGLYLHSELGCIPTQYESYTQDRSMSSISDYQLWSPETYKILDMDGFGTATVSFLNGTQCPDTHFRCKRRLCIPSYLVNNGVNDCPYPDRSDEAANMSYCPGYYRCLRSGLYLHPRYLCDGVLHCPERDDELYCSPECPPHCLCKGHEYICTREFPAEGHVMLKYLDMSGVPRPFRNDNAIFPLLIYLNLSNCRLDAFSFPYSLSVKILDLSYNRIISLYNVDITLMVMLRYLDLSHNLLDPQYLEGFLFLRHGGVFLTHLSMRNMGILGISAKVFARNTLIERLDLRHNDIKILTSESWSGLNRLNVLLADDQKLCCLYRSHMQRNFTCVAPVDELSSCSDLLRALSMRIVIWLQCALGLTGNIVAFLSKVFVQRHSKSCSHGVLVIHLCVADCLMGVYLAFIGAADIRYRGVYLWEQSNWTQSQLCLIAGFCSFLSSEVSAFLICLITLDRFLVVRFPFRQSVHLTPWSATLGCAAIWTAGVLLAVVPLLPPTRHWEFYGQTGICLPLPITRHTFPGHTFAFAIYIGLNFVLFLLIGLGQLAIYLSIRSTPSAGRAGRNGQDTAIARRLSFIVLTDFCCWFPVGAMGLLAAAGVPIPGEANAWTAVCILPLNSALNPSWYTLNTLRARYLERRRKMLLADLQKEITKWPRERLLQLGRHYEAALKRLEREQGNGTVS